ncbi:hypothetical protein PI124_g12943 [Phytophthora idaei]|nr:hypothetical protein PI125_g12480 [Phytophthora idaei]KAG3150422.1 hypothetical protein PI126_g11514 [Phytophthora idaei]KAG3242194.1 hypothetical protein PI124_g12943 [Phytophthora idaei]
MPPSSYTDSTSPEALASTPSLNGCNDVWARLEQTEGRWLSTMITPRVSVATALEREDARIRGGVPPANTATSGAMGGLLDSGALAFDNMATHESQGAPDQAYCITPASAATASAASLLDPGAKITNDAAGQYAATAGVKGNRARGKGKRAASRVEKKPSAVLEWTHYYVMVHDLMSLRYET